MFKTGQIVWCKRKNTYIQTDYHVKCVVVGIMGYLMRVKILEGENAGRIWNVDSGYFELAQCSAKIV